MPKIIGHGKQQVYVYYYSAYKLIRLQDGYYDWPCKIGWTRDTAMHRIGQQVKTSSPEKPEIGLIVKCNDGYLLEQALHAILRLYHKDLRGATGDEWFLTTPDEVAGLCKLLRQA